MRAKTLLSLLLLPVSSLICAATEVEALLYPSREIVLAAASAGALQERAVVEGSEVQVGDLIARIDDANEQLQVSRLEKVVEKRRFDAEGFAQLRRKDMASETEARDARVEWDLSVIDLQEARQRLSQKQLHAPIDGVVTHLDKDVGEWVQAGEPVAELVHLDELHAVFFLPWSLAAQLQPGQPLTFRLSTDGPADDAPVLHPARILFISPQIDGASGLLTCKAALDNTDRQLRPGQSGVILLPAAP